MIQQELLEALLGRDGAATLGVVTLLLIDHLETEHDVPHAEACRRLGSDEEKIGMLRLMLEDATKDGGG